MKAIKEEKIEEKEVCCLNNAKMKYPTWGLFTKLIKEARDENLPNNWFGGTPMQNQNNTFVEVTAVLNGINNHNYVGIDVPVLLTPEGRSTKDKTIVIVGESPLRDTKNTDNKNKVLLGTPYAIHQKFGCPSQCNVYKKIFSDLLQEGYSIYLTDVIKVWWDGKTGKELKTDKNDKELFDDEMDEMKKLGDNLVFVAWGKKAKNYLDKWKKSPIIELPHPSQQNWNNWKLHIFEKAIYDKEDISYAKGRYPNEESKTSEVIVAREAVSEILEKI